MGRIQPVPVEKAPRQTKEIYDGIQKKLGKVPNIFLNMGNSPATLKGYLSLSDAASQTSLSPKLREQIALIVSQTNNCNYCLSAHTAIAQGAGVSEQEIIQARKGQAQDSKTQAILAFAKSVVEKRGSVTEQDIASLKSAGVTDAEIVEITLNIILTIFTNYFNHIADTKIDFPVAPKLS